MDFAAKYWDFIDHSAKVEILEGTTASGKTVAALHKFMLEVAESPRRLHVIAAKTTGVAEKNLINSDAGLIYQFGELVSYHGNGNAQNRLPHICFHYCEDDDKIIYILGYDDKGKWANALGSQFGCVLIDEINTAHPDFVREISSRCTYLMGTLNPDDPELPVYSEYINCCRPLPKYAKDVPPEIAQALAAVPPKPGWDYWFGGYANPSFEAQVETVGKANQSGIMSVETAVEELYGDDKKDDWKQKEVQRIKAERGIVEMEEPAVNQSAAEAAAQGAIDGA